MADIASGIAKRLTYKAESSWGVAAGASSAQVLRRVSSELDLRKETYQSNEIRTDYQVADLRHGMRRIDGSINGELSPGTYKDFMAAAVRKAFASVTAITGLSITISGSGPTYTVARGSGSWITDGVKLGMVGRLSAGSFDAANLAKNLLVVGETATDLTVLPLNGVDLVAEGPIASSTFTVTGKVAYVPETSHTDPSFSIEHFYEDISQRELFLGCKLSQMDIALPPTGIATVGMQFMGKDVETDTTAYFTSPTAQSSTGLLQAVNGALYLGGAAVALVTGLNFSVNGNMSGEGVVGSNTYPGIQEGRVLVTGQFTAFFQNATLRDYFINETEVALIAALTTSNEADADFISFAMPRIKVQGAGKNDGERGLVQTFPFQALLNIDGGSSANTHKTTLQIQDSQA